MEKMSLRGSCCSCLRGEEEEEGYRHEADYLLPGGEWDPSLSGPSKDSPRRSRGRSRGRGRRSRDRDGRVADDGTESESGSFYTPPEVPWAVSSPPSFQDFKLLKTVGKGAFGKV